MPAKRKTTRRQFILGHSAIDAIDEFADGVGADAVESNPRDAVTSQQATYLIQIARQLMACDFAVYLNAGQYADAAETAIRALDLVESLEDQMTVYRDDSELIDINRRAASDAMAVEAQLFSLFEHAVELYEETHGAFDITAGPLSKVWGFYRRQGRIPSDTELQQALSQVGSNLLELNRDGRTVRFKRDGVEINLGAIGKGYALDRCVRLLLDEGVDNFLIHGGQSSVAARGLRSGGDPSTLGWTVGLKHPLRPERRLAEIHLRDRALGTSGSAAQSFRHEGRRYGHILDPRTGRPAEGVLSATVLAPQAATADALATAFYVMGVEASLNFCREHAELATILVTEGLKSGSVQFHTAGLNRDDWTCLVE